MTPQTPGTATLISHRGFWWPDRLRHNTLDAIRAAFEAGFGVEVDVRRALDGSLVLSHDPPSVGLLAWEDFLDLAWSFPSCQIFVNIKEPDTEADVAQGVRRYGCIPRGWLFDFELCGADPLVAKAAAPEVHLLARVSDRVGTGLDPEAPSALPHWAAGVWLDQWDADWVTPETIAAWRGVGAEVFVVSSELHGRTLDLARAEKWREADGICTDVPHLVQRVLEGDERLCSANIWWGA